MKKYLSSAIILALLLLIPGTAYSADKLEYYQDLVEKWNFDVIKNTKEVDQEKPTSSVTPTPVPTVPSDSEQEPQPLPTIAPDTTTDKSSKYTIRTEQNYTFIIHTNEDEFSAVRGEKIDLGFTDYLTNDNANLTLITQNQTREVHVPQRYLIDPTISDNVSQYYQRLNDALDVKPDKNTSGDGLIDAVTQETFGYALLLFIFAALIINVYKKALKNPSKPKTYYAIFRSYYDGLIKTLTLIRPFIIILLILAVLGLYRLLTIISMMDKEAIVGSYIVSTLFNSFKLNFFTQALAARSEISLVLGIASQITLLLAILALLPNTMYLLERSAEKLSKLKINQSNSINFLIGLLVALFSALALLPLNINYTFPTYLILIAAFFILKTSRLDFKLPLKQTLLILLVPLVFTALIVFYRNHKLNNPPLTENNFLGDNLSSVVFLPRYQTMKGENPFLVVKRNLNEEIPVYINDYLVYHPEYTVIQNQNLSFLENPTSDFYIVTPTKTEDFAKLVFDNENVRKYLASNRFTNTIYVENVEWNKNSQLYYEIEITCNTDIESTLIDAEYINKEGSSVKSDNDVALNFPGCSEGDKFSLQLKPTKDLYMTQYLITFKFPTAMNATIKLFNGENEVPVEYYNLDRQMAKFVDVNQNSDVITSVSNITKELTFEKPQDFSYRDFLNANFADLKAIRQIKDDILIWSPVPEAVIYENFKE